MRDGPTIQAARGQWRRILVALGIPKLALDGNNRPCPACGGRDRFQFTDRSRDGDYICRGCGAGKGLRLLCRVHGWKMAEAMRRVDELIGRKGGRPPDPSDHRHCCETPAEAAAHRAAIAFFELQPDFDPPAPYEPVKSLRDATLWLRRYDPLKLPEWLNRHDPKLTEWIERERPLGYFKSDAGFTGFDLASIQSRP